MGKEKKWSFSLHGGDADGVQRCLKVVDGGNEGDWEERQHFEESARGMIKWKIEDSDVGNKRVVITEQDMKSVWFISRAEEEIWPEG